MFKIIVMKYGQWFYTKTIGVNIEDDDCILETCLTSFSTQMSSNINGKEEVDNTLINRNDHDEGELINIV